MADCFNLLSGATIDNRSGLLYEILRSGKCYAGFSRNIETWGQLCLFKYKRVSGQSWPTDVVGVGGEIYDQYNIRLEGVGSGQNVVFIGSYVVTGAAGEIIPPDPNGLNYVSGPHAPPEQNPEVIFINDEWITLKYVDPTKLWPLEDSLGREIKYYIVNHAKSSSNMLEIEKVSEYQYPGLDTQVYLKYTTQDATSYNFDEADFAPISTPLMRRLNIQGEYIITGATEELINWFRLEGASSYNFFLADGSIPEQPGNDTTGGAMILSNIRFEEIIENESETALVFSYSVMVNNLDQIRPRFKITTLGNINNRMGVYHESLPVWQHVSPVSDGNPPGLPVGYLRNPAFNSSIFDTVGLKRIDFDDVWFCKEIRENDMAYWQAEVADNTANFDMTIDYIQIDINSVSQLAVYQYYVKCKDLTYGLKNNFTNTMYDKNLSSSDPTGDIYRQFFISFTPKIPSGGGFANASDPAYSGRGTFWSADQHKTDMGIVLYLANKIPVYRNFIGTSGENFKIVI